MVHNSTHKCQPLQGEERRRDKEWVWTAIHLSSSCLPLRAFPLLSVHNSTIEHAVFRTRCDQQERAWCGCGTLSCPCVSVYFSRCRVMLYNKDRGVLYICCDQQRPDPRP